MLEYKFFKLVNSVYLNLMFNDLEGKKLINCESKLIFGAYDPLGKIT